MSTSRKRSHYGQGDQHILDASLRVEQAYLSMLDQKDARIAALEALLETDELTGLPNKRKLDQTEAIYRRDSDSSGKPFGIVYIDMDHFKKVNDTFGHDVGDEVLKIFARKLRAYFRADDIVGREHGDEFKVIIREATPQLEERLEKTYNTGVNGEEVITFGEAKYRVNIQSSYGFKAYDLKNPEATSSQADTAMFETKRFRKDLTLVHARRASDDLKNI